MRNRLTNWKEKIDLLNSPGNRPNDFQKLIIRCSNNGMNVRDAHRVFGIAERTVRDWKTQFSDKETEEDMIYFMRRARELGADDETIAQWFGLEQVEKVNVILAE